MSPRRKRTGLRRLTRVRDLPDIDELIDAHRSKKGKLKSRDAAALCAQLEDTSKQLNSQVSVLVGTCLGLATAAAAWLLASPTPAAQFCLIPAVGLASTGFFAALMASERLTKVRIGSAYSENDVRASHSSVSRKIRYCSYARVTAALALIVLMLAGGLSL